MEVQQVLSYQISIVIHLIEQAELKVKIIILVKERNSFSIIIAFFYVVFSPLM